MTSDPANKDLIVLVADTNMRFCVEGLLSRHRSLTSREISRDVYKHPHHDPGCLLRGHDFLRPFSRQYAHALVMLDREGCGRDDSTREELEAAIEQRLSQSGWGGRAAAVVIDPELEIWVWSDSPEVDAVLGWAHEKPTLAEWLTAEGFRAPDQQKPDRPKEAVEQALRIARKPRSSAIYLQLAERVSVNRCVDPAFVRFKRILGDWFGPPLP